MLSKKDGNIEEKLILPSFLKSIKSSLFYEYSTVLYRFANIISKADNTVTQDEIESLKILYEWTHKPNADAFISNKELNKSEFSSPIAAIENRETLDDVLLELNSLIGLNNVKEQIETLMNFIKVQKAREASGL